MEKNEIDPVTLVTELAEVTGGLVEVTACENEALRRMDRKRLSELLPRKETVSRRYVELLRILRMEVADITIVPEAARARLRDVFARFQAAADENMRLLDNLKQASEKLIKTIAGAMQEQEPVVQAYSKAGTMSGYGRQRIGPRPAAVTFNRTL